MGIEISLTIIAAFLAIGGAIARTRRDEEKAFYWPNWYGWVVIILVVASGILGIKKLINTEADSTAKSTKIDSLSVQLTNAQNDRNDKALKIDALSEELQSAKKDRELKAKKIDDLSSGLEEAQVDRDKKALEIGNLSKQLQDAKKERDRINRANQLLLLSTVQNDLEFKFYIPFNPIVSSPTKGELYLIDVLYEGHAELGPKDEQSLLLSAELVSSSSKIKISHWTFVENPYDVSTLGFALLNETGTEMDLGKVKAYAKPVIIDECHYLEITFCALGEFQVNQWISELEPHNLQLDIMYWIGEDIVIADQKALLNRLERIYPTQKKGFLKIPLLNTKGFCLQCPVITSSPILKDNNVTISIQLADSPNLIFPSSL